MIFESHAHYDDERFDPDRDELLSAMREQGIETIINVGASMEGSRASILLAEKYEDVYAALGVHPDEIEGLTEKDMEWMENMATHDKVVSIGEIGLDYYGDEKTDEDKLNQKRWFIRQLEVAKEVNLPVIVHSRDAAEPTMQILKEHGTGNGVIHCYSYSMEMAKEYVKMGYYIGVGGVVTFKNGRKLQETVEEIPLNRILLETDCPYLSPVPHRGERNDSTNLYFVAEKIAQIKGVSEQKVIEVTRDNARELFSKVK